MDDTQENQETTISDDKAKDDWTDPDRDIGRVIVATGSDHHSARPGPGVLRFTGF